MHHDYSGVVTRFLRAEERLVLSEEKEMPLVIEAQNEKSSDFLQQFLADNTIKLIEDLAKYGAILFRGFQIDSDEQFEKSLLSIQGFRGISDAFMSENGRTHVGDLRFVLHTNSVYKTGGTLYLGGFHTENYYSTDVPGYISFCCLEPSSLGGETGIINTEKIYKDFSQELQKKLEKRSFFVSKWLVSEVAERYQITPEQVRKIAAYFNLPIVGSGESQFVMMYKPSVFIHPLTREKALQINLFELASLNFELRKCFMRDYSGAAWFWHRFFWRLPTPLFQTIESLAVAFIALFHSPRNAYAIVRHKWAAFQANRNTKISEQDKMKVGSCFTKQDVKDLAKSMRRHYSSCLWQKGDILLVDNRKVMHAGMPGKGSRTVRALIGNPIEMNYLLAESGCIESDDRNTESIGTYMATGDIPGGKK